MTPNDRLIELINAVRHIVRAHIPGAVECGVWRGGSMMAAGLALQQSGDTTRDLYLFDTFTGQPHAGTEDRNFRDRQSTTKGMWSVPESVVRANLAKTGYPSERIRTVPGSVESMLPNPGTGRLRN